jgi:hypothetical protein
MDAQRFDALARSLTETGSRRGLLALLAVFPVLGSLFALLDLEEVDAKGRRKRRKKRHKHGKGRRRKHHNKQCKAPSLAKTCAGKCGPVVDRCQKTVDCGPCACIPNDPCTAGVCGTVQNSCGQDVPCGACPTGQLCAENQCVTGQGSCAAGDNFCLDSNKSCNGSCRCRISTEGDTRCSGIAPGGGTDCGECAQSSDCAVLYPAIPGVFCMQGGLGCCNGTAPAGLCHAPCPV